MEHLQFKRDDLVKKIDEIDNDVYIKSIDKLLFYYYDIGGAFNRAKKWSSETLCKLRSLEISASLKDKSLLRKMDLLDNVLSTSLNEHHELINYSKKISHIKAGNIAEFNETSSDDLVMEMKEAHNIINFDSGKMITMLELLCDEYSDILGRTKKLRKENDIFGNDVAVLGFLVSDLVYRLNVRYSPNFASEIYSLKDSAKALYTRQKEWAFDDKIFPRIEESALHNVLKGFDYYNNVVDVLVKYAYDYEYDSENDTHKRLKIPFSRRIHLGSVDDDVKKNIKVFVKDNGFGLKTGLGLFNDDAQSRDNMKKYSFGLWMARTYVEENCGKMGCMSTTGQELVLFFTIPYNAKECAGVYR